VPAPLSARPSTKMISPHYNPVDELIEVEQSNTSRQKHIPEQIKSAITSVIGLTSSPGLTLELVKCWT